MDRHGRGGGRGRGYGGGRHRGGCGTQGNGLCVRELGPRSEHLQDTGSESTHAPLAARGEAETLAELKQQAEAIERQLQEVQSRLSVGPAAVQHRVAVVDHESCTICGICASLCPSGAITVKDRVEVNASQCSGCGACVQRCPSKAIRLA